MLKVINKYLTFKNNVQIISYISEINNTFIESAENLDIIMLMYGLLQYSENMILKRIFLNATLAFRPLFLYFPSSQCRLSLVFPDS